MKNQILAALAFCGTAFGANFGATMSVYASPAPSVGILNNLSQVVGVSPNFDGWAANAINALNNNLSSFGDPASSPTAYYQTTTGNQYSDLITSTFNSWNGAAAPGGAFAGEFGNKLHFGVVAEGIGTQIALEDLSWVLSSSDPDNAFGFSGSFAGSFYNQYRVGVINGSGGPTYITSGGADQLVDKILYVGVGSALIADFGGLGCIGGTNQQTLDCAADLLTTIMPFSITTTYTLLAPSMSDSLLDSGPIAVASATVNFDVATPEPGTWSLLFAGSAALFLARRRRTNQ